MSIEIIQVQDQNHSRCEGINSRFANEINEEVCRIEKLHEMQGYI